MSYKIKEIYDLYYVLPNGSTHNKVYEHYIKYREYEQLFSRKFNFGLYITKYII